MENKDLMNKLAALPHPDFMHACKLSDPIGSESSYRARTVVLLIEQAVAAERLRCLDIANRHAQMASSQHAGEKARTAWSIAAQIESEAKQI